MPIALRCSCGKAFRVKESLLGKQVACPECKDRLEVSPLETSICNDHPDRDAVGKCRKCKGGFCEDCLKAVKGKTFCRPCLKRLKKKAKRKRRKRREQESGRVRGESVRASGRRSARQRQKEEDKPQSGRPSAGSRKTKPPGKSEKSDEGASERRTPSGKVQRGFFNPDYNKAKEEIARSTRVPKANEAVGLEVLSSGRATKQVKVEKPERKALSVTISLAIAAAIGIVGALLTGWATLQLDLSILYAFAIGAAVGGSYNFLSKRNPGPKVLRIGAFVGLAVVCFGLKLGLVWTLGYQDLETSVAATQGIIQGTLEDDIKERQAWINGEKAPPASARTKGITRKQQQAEWQLEIDELEERLEARQAVSAEEATAELLESETGQAGALGFLRYYALYGTEEPPLDQEEAPSPLLTYLLWLLEVGLIFFVPFWMVTQRW